MWLERFIIVVVSLHRDFLTFIVGHVLPHSLGLDDFHRHHRHVPCRHVPVPAAFARDFDFEMRTLLPEAEVKARMKRDPIYGIMAEFASAQALLRRRQAYA